VRTAAIDGRIADMRSFFAIGAAASGTLLDANRRLAADYRHRKRGRVAALASTAEGLLV